MAKAHAYEVMDEFWMRVELLIVALAKRLTLKQRRSKHL